MVLDDIKVLKNITDESKDAQINLLIRKAVTVIKNYLQSDIDAENLYPDAVIEYVIFSLNKKGNEGLKQFSQGSRSGTYEDGIPQTVKALLPLPSIGIRG